MPMRNMNPFLQGQMGVGAGAGPGMGAGAGMGARPGMGAGLGTAMPMMGQGQGQEDKRLWQQIGDYPQASRGKVEKAVKAVIESWLSGGQMEASKIYKLQKATLIGPEIRAFHMLLERAGVNPNQLVPEMFAGKRQPMTSPWQYSDEAGYPGRAGGPPMGRAMPPAAMGMGAGGLGTRTPNIRPPMGGPPGPSRMPPRDFSSPGAATGTPAWDTGRSPAPEWMKFMYGGPEGAGRQPETAKSAIGQLLHGMPEEDIQARARLGEQVPKQWQTFITGKETAPDQGLRMQIEWYARQLIDKNPDMKYNEFERKMREKFGKDVDLVVTP